MIRVVLPPHLRTLAHVGMEVSIDVRGAITQRSVLDALEASYPMLCGTIRDHDTKERRPFLRFFVCGEDWSHESPDHPLPQEVAGGKEPFLVIGAIAGSAIPLGLEFHHQWQIPVLAGALVWFFVFRRSVVSGLLIAGALGVVVALAGVPV